MNKKKERILIGWINDDTLLNKADIFIIFWDKFS